MTVSHHVRLAKDPFDIEAAEEREARCESCFRLFTNTAYLVLGLITIISVFIAMFTLNGFGLLFTPATISLSMVLIIIGLVFIAAGAFLLVNTMRQNLITTLKLRLVEAERELQLLKGEQSPKLPQQVVEETLEQPVEEEVVIDNLISSTTLGDFRKWREGST